MLRHAIVRPPGPSFAAGLTTAGLGPPDLERAREQHARYGAALEQCGLALTWLVPEAAYPDSPFVEDCAVLAPDLAVVTRPGAASRRGEAASVRAALESFFGELHEIAPPGTLDGGDVCQAGDHFVVGISARTNEDGAGQLARALARRGQRVVLVDIRRVPGLLHLKSGVAWLGDGRLLATAALAGHEAFAGFEIVRVAAGEDYAANCVRVNDRILVAAGFPETEAALRRLGYSVIALEVSEFRKMDGGLSCLSLRF